MTMMVFGYLILISTDFTILFLCFLLSFSFISEDISSTHEIANQVIWNNQFICIESKSIYNSRLIDLGIVRIGDLYDTQGDFKSNKEPLYSTLTPVEHFLLFSLCNALPEEWRKILKTNRNSICSKTHYLIQTDFILRIEGKKSTCKVLNLSHYMTVSFLRYPVYQQRKRNTTKLSARTHPS